MNIITMPHYQYPNCQGPSSIEWKCNDTIARTVSPFTGAETLYDWQNGFWSVSLSFKPMDNYAAQLWQAFLLQARSGLNSFYLGDDRYKYPRGTAKGTPVINGSDIGGYSLPVRGFDANQIACLQAGDKLQVATHIYTVTTPFSSDANGNGSVSVWPNIRGDGQVDGIDVNLIRPKGLFRLKDNNHSFSTTTGLYGMNSLELVEVL